MLKNRPPATAPGVLSSGIEIRGVLISPIPEIGYSGHQL